MSWFGSLIAQIINALATSIQNSLGNALYNVIKTSTFATVPSLGQGSFSNILGAHATSQLSVFYEAFWAIGGCFVLLSVHFLAASLSSAGNSTVHRQRLKRGLITLGIACGLMGAGQLLAIVAGEILYYFTLYFLQIGGAGGQQVHMLSTSGTDGILNAVVNFIQVFMSLLIWITYQFRKIFLFVWMVFFPVAMAFYANDRTRNITKMWWTEWIYQMAIPMGQGLVYGIAHVITMGNSNTTLSDMFVAIAGTIGLLGSAVYVRRMIDAVAQTFGTSSIGHSSGEGRMHSFAMGVGAGVGDALGGVAVRQGAGMLGGTLGKAARALDNSSFIRGKAENALKAAPEKHAGSILNGASMDDMMMHHQMAAHGDPLQANMAGSKGAETSPGASSGGVGRASQRGGSGGAKSILGGRTGSRTMGALGEVMGQAKQGFASSNTAKAIGGAIQKHQDKGGVVGKAMSATAPALASFAASKGNAGAQVSQHLNRHMANRENRAQRTEKVRDHLRQVMQTNALQQRVPHINGQYDTENREFTGPSPAEKKYTSARQQFVDAMEHHMGMTPESAHKTASQAEYGWNDGQHWKGLGASHPKVQQAYRAAYTSYRPAQLDSHAKEAVVNGEIGMQMPKDPHQNKKHGTDAFLQDARIAMLHKR